MKTFTKIAVTAVLSVGLVGSTLADHDRDHGRREFHGEHHDRGSSAGWFLGGLVLGSIIVDANRPREYIPPFRTVRECRDVIVIDYSGYEHYEQRCRVIEVPVEE